jgi:hypothetical protein
LNEKSWQAWVEKGRESERRNSALGLVVVKCAGIAGLLALAALWSSVIPFEIVVRFAVAFGAIVLMFQAWRQKRYAWVAAFAVLAVIYNPVAPLFNFSGDWQRAVVVASAGAFAASLVWSGPKLAVR